MNDKLFAEALYHLLTYQKCIACNDSKQAVIGFDGKDWIHGPCGLCAKRDKYCIELRKIIELK